MGTPNLLDGFDPEKNESDRRILYEVVGMRLDHMEFRDEDTIRENQLCFDFT